MHKLTDSELKNLKKIELEILHEIDRLCRLHSVRYSLAYGTLIGAVRHGGFIPWDDDIDIMMLRDDYERFMEIAERELSPWFFVTAIENCKDYGIPFMKIMAKKTVMRESSAATSKVAPGVWVDIFPMDASPKGDDLKAAQYAEAQRLKSIMCCKANYKFNKHGVSLAIYRLRKLAYIFRSHFKYVEEFTRNAKRYQNTPLEDDKVVCLCGNIGVKKATFERSWFDGFSDMRFEDGEFMAIDGYDAFLKHTYGDYMSLPPENERISHHFVEEIFLDDFLNEYKRPE